MDLVAAAKAQRAGGASKARTPPHPLPPPPLPAAASAPAAAASDSDSEEPFDIVRAAKQRSAAASAPSPRHKHAGSAAAAPREPPGVALKPAAASRSSPPTGLRSSAECRSDDDSSDGLDMVALAKQRGRFPRPPAFAASATAASLPSPQRPTSAERAQSSLPAAESGGSGAQRQLRQSITLAHGAADVEQAAAAAGAFGQPSRQETVVAREGRQASSLLELAAGPLLVLEGEPSAPPQAPAFAFSSPSRQHSRQPGGAPASAGRAPAQGRGQGGYSPAAQAQLQGSPAVPLASVDDIGEVLTGVVENLRCSLRWVAWPWGSAPPPLQACWLWLNWSLCCAVPLTAPCPSPPHPAAPTSGGWRRAGRRGGRSRPAAPPTCGAAWRAWPPPAPRRRRRCRAGCRWAGGAALAGRPNAWLHSLALQPWHIKPAARAASAVPCPQALQGELEQQRCRLEAVERQQGGQARMATAEAVAPPAAPAAPPASTAGGLPAVEAICRRLSALESRVGAQLVHIEKQMALGGGSGGSASAPTSPMHWAPERGGHACSPLGGAARSQSRAAHAAAVAAAAVYGTDGSEACLPVSPAKHAPAAWTAYDMAPASPRILAAGLLRPGSSGAGAYGAPLEAQPRAKRPSSCGPSRCSRAEVEGQVAATHRLVAGIQGQSEWVGKVCMAQSRALGLLQFACQNRTLGLAASLNNLPPLQPTPSLPAVAAIKGSLAHTTSELDVRRAEAGSAALRLEALERTERYVVGGWVGGGRGVGQAGWMCDGHGSPQLASLPPCCRPA